MAGEKLIKIMQKASEKANNTNDLSDMLYGTVTSENPLKIKVDNRFEVDSNFLVLSPFCYKKEIEIAGEKVLLWDKLKHNDKVVMLRVQKGQRYFIFNKA